MEKKGEYGTKSCLSSLNSITKNVAAGYATTFRD
ncbi:Uncharacterised protein [Vibrio cholerae]|nr:Uncharacterised protein [Vibrio cholerae]